MLNAFTLKIKKHAHVVICDIANTVVDDMYFNNRMFPSLLIAIVIKKPTTKNITMATTEMRFHAIQTNQI